MRAHRTLLGAESDPYLDAADAALSHLGRRPGMAAWAVTATDGQDWTLLRVRGGERLGLVDGTVLPWADSICARMVRTQGPGLVPDLLDHPTYAQAPIVERLGLCGYAGVALRNADGEVRGSLCAVATEDLGDHTFDGLAQEMALCARMLDLVAQSQVQRDQALTLAGEARLRAHADPLTGLGNRASWLASMLEHPPLRDGQEVVIVSVDLDGLKAVNDRQGHAAGDRLLQSVAVALREELPAALEVARVGGDEFVLLLPSAPGEGTGEVAERLRRCLQERRLPAAVGAAAWGPDRSAAEAWAEADRAMYEDKRWRAERVTGPRTASP